MTKEAIVWTLPVCNMCERTKSWLKGQGVSYTEMDLTEPESVDDLAYFKSLGLRAAPIVEVVVENSEGFLDHVERWSGFNIDKLEEHFA